MAATLTIQPAFIDYVEDLVQTAEGVAQAQGISVAAAVRQMLEGANRFHAVIDRFQAREAAAGTPLPFDLTQMPTPGRKQ